LKKKDKKGSALFYEKQKISIMQANIFQSIMTHLFPHHYATTKSSRCFSQNTASFSENVATFSATHNYRFKNQ